MANKRKTTKKVEETNIESINPNIPNDPTQTTNVEINENEAILDLEPTNVSGAGDIVKKITNALGIKQCDDCKKRQQKMNAMFPILKRAVRELTVDEVDYILTTKANKKVDNIQVFFKLYNEVYNDKRRACQCVQLMVNMLDELIQLIEYQKAGRGE